MKGGPVGKVKESFVQQIGAALRTATVVQLDMLKTIQTNHESILHLVQMNEDWERRAEGFDEQIKKLKQAYLFYTLRNNVSLKERYEFGEKIENILEPLRGTDLYEKMKATLEEIK